MATHTTTISVRWGESDAAGIVYYPRFYEWYDLGSEGLFASVGLPWLELFPNYKILGVPIVESGSTFTAPVRYGDVVVIRSTVAWVKNKTFRIDHEVSVGTTLCARGFEVRAWVARPDGPRGPIRATPIPDEVARRLQDQAGHR